MDSARFRIRPRPRRRVRRTLVTTALVTVAASIVGLPAGPNPLDLLRSNPGRATAPDGRDWEGGDAAASMVRFRRRVVDGRTRPARNTQQGEQGDPAEAPGEEGSISDVVYAAAAEFGLGGDYLLAIAHCESTLNPYAINPAGYYGLFQFDQQTWAAYGYGDIYDPVAQARTAARLLAAGQASRWPNCA